MSLELIVIFPMLLCFRALYINVKYIKKCPPEFWFTRAATVSLAICYLGLFIAYECQLISAEMYAILGTSLSVPSFEFIWTRPTIISARLTADLMQAEEKINTALDEVRTRLGEIQNED